MLARILMITVSVDDHVCAQPQARIQPSLKRKGQAAIMPQRHDVISAGGLCLSRRAIDRTIVDDQHFDRIEAGQRARHITNDLRDGGLFVVSGNLDDEFHVGFCISMTGRACPLRSVMSAPVTPRAVSHQAASTISRIVNNVLDGALAGSHSVSGKCCP